jgi:hypothetical protein
MAHILAKMNGVKVEDLRKQLESDAPGHAQHGLYLEYVWQNADDSADVMFVFRTEDLKDAKQFIQKVHTQALKEDPDARLAEMTFLEDK